MAAVAPDDANRNVCYGKPFATEALWGTNFTGKPWPADYVARREALGAKYCALPDGRRLCYWTDGDPGGVPVVAFHGGCEGKYKWMQKAPIPGVFLVAVDRPHYGGSSAVSLDYTFADAARDVAALADSLGIDQFVCMGHSVGTSWCQQVAAALPSRVRGIVLFASMADPRHDEADFALRRAVGYYPLGDCGPCGTSDACCHPFSGACGCLPRAIMASLTGLAGKSAGVKAEANYRGGLGAEGVRRFQADPFWVASMVDSWGAHWDGDAILGDTKRSLVGKWAYDTRDITCPVRIFQGEADLDVKVPATTDFLQRLIPHARIEIVAGFGHVCTNGPNEWTVARIVDAVAGMPRLDGAPPRAELAR